MNKMNVSGKNKKAVDVILKTVLREPVIIDTTTPEFIEETKNFVSRCVKLQKAFHALELRKNNY